jgi:hypothetical protein
MKKSKFLPGFRIDIGEEQVIEVGNFGHPVTEPVKTNVPLFIALFFFDRALRLFLQPL